MKKVIIAFFLLTTLLIFPPDAYAASCSVYDTTKCLSNEHCNFSKGLCELNTTGSPAPKLSGSTVDTALGPIPTEPVELVKWFLKNAIIMGGGIAFLLSVFGGVSIILAGGNPEKINAGKEIISSALTGLLFIVFSVFLLRLIGFDILQLPGFKNP